MSHSSEYDVEDVLRLDLAESDAVIGSLGPILRHLLASESHSLFSDETIARVRGITEDIARQLLHAQAAAAGTAMPEDFAAACLDPLADALLGNAALLSHLHALALEWQLAERLHARNGLDPVLSPMLQALIASSDARTAAAAMTALAAQARFVQSLRRMELALTELPGDLLHIALVTLRTLASEADGASAQAATAALRAGFDEARSRLGLLSRLVTGMGGGAIAALSVEHAGVAIFLTAISIGSGQDRDLAILSTNDRQLARLALALRAAGLKPAAVEEQFAYLHPDVALPAGFGQVRADRAAALLAAATPFSAG
ncbi:MAG: hypothetical protein P0Y56_01270 [Candidatus Andeanibacterium colombiense]|uniref:DUF2336 domain-containing protein n=1 Tax=Candidatus Andeanibacterium colombiense TaxID=3121345 RepID=A0AAJ6BPY8_9SPHN|nr:MAG: hypothetical protein P0Y56_01270 [Sphingomonadaceae bacterium]